MKKFRKVITLALAFTLAFSLICSQKAFAAAPSLVDLEFSVVAKIKQADGSYKVYYPGYDIVYNKIFDFPDNDIDAALASIDVNLLDNDEKAKIFAWFKENGIEINNANESEFFAIDTKAHTDKLYFRVSDDSPLTEGDIIGLTEGTDYYVRFLIFLEAVGTYEAAAPAQSNGGATTGETPAAPAKADPNKSPNTSESHAFVFFMLGIMAVAGMGLYAGKRQEN